MTQFVNELLSWYTGAMQAAPYPTLAVTILVVAIGLWVINYPDWRR